MLFNSLQFAIFLPIVLTVYYLLPHKGQNRFLLVASCVFYAAWDWRFLFPLLFSTTIDYYTAYRMEDLIRSGAPKEARKVGSSRVDLQACKLEYSIVSPK